MATLGKWITLISGGLAALCTAPILLYGAFGPPDGNPIGLGLLMAFGTPPCLAGVVLGLLVWGIGRLSGGHRSG